MKFTLYIDGGSIPLALQELLRRANRPAFVLRTLATIALSFPNLKEQIHNEVANFQWLVGRRSADATQVRERVRIVLSDTTSHRIEEIANRFHLQPIDIFERLCVLAWNHSKLTQPSLMPNQPTDVLAPSPQVPANHYEPLPQLPTASVCGQQPTVSNEVADRALPDFSMMKGFQF